MHRAPAALGDDDEVVAIRVAEDRDAVVADNCYRPSPPPNECSRRRVRLPGLATHRSSIGVFHWQHFGAVLSRSPPSPSWAFPFLRLRILRETSHGTFNSCDCTFRSEWRVRKEHEESSDLSLVPRGFVNSWSITFGPLKKRLTCD